LTCREALYGGAAGGGKSDALLMGALQYVDVPGYNALLLRRSLQSLELPGGLIPRLADWLKGTAARWSASKRRWTFPSGATITFGYFDKDRDKDRYQGPEFQYIGVDELTQHPLERYTWLFSRLRRLAGFEVPLRVRGGTNPGGIGHEWVARRFDVLNLGANLGPDRAYVPALLDDNPSLDREEYEESLSELDPVTRERMLRGDWSVRPSGGIFKREWFEVISPEEVPAGMRWIRVWDTASKTKERNDFWAGGRMGSHGGIYYLAHVVHGKWEYPDGRAMVKQTAKLDGTSVPIVVEDANSGTALLQDLRMDRDMAGHAVFAIQAQGDKLLRAGPWASRAKGGLVKLVEGSWDVEGFLDETVGFGQPGIHDDRVDMFGTGYRALTRFGAVLGGSRAPAGPSSGDDRQSKVGRGRASEARAPRRV
jgi:predicted phage terminase large subunit-like protein